MIGSSNGGGVFIGTSDARGAKDAHRIQNSLRLFVIRRLGLRPYGRPVATVLGTCRRPQPQSRPLSRRLMPVSHARSLAIRGRSAEIP